MSRELLPLSKSVIGTSSASMCPKHPGYGLDYFNAKEGRKQCLMCIMKSSVAEGGREKERFCIKHPGYENSFYCANDQKVCCEKCLVYHKKHKVESIALKAATLREKFDDYKSEFVTVSKQWAGFYNGVKTKKDSIETEIDKASRSIETIFDAMLEKLKKRRTDTILTFKKKAWGMIQEFNEKYKECEAEVKDINRHSEEFNELAALFNSGDNMELITKAMELNVEDLVDNYCPALQQKLDQYRGVFTDLRGKTNYSFTVVNNFNEDEVAEFINKQFVVKIAKSEKPDEPLSGKESQMQPLSPEPNELAPVGESPPAGKDEPVLHKFDGSNKLLWTYQGQFATVPLAVMKSPAKLARMSPGKGTPQALENWDDLRSQKLSFGDIFAFEEGDKGTNALYRYMPDTLLFSIAVTLPFNYRKLSLSDLNGKLYIGGEPCELSEDTKPPQVLAFDMSTGTIESLGAGLPKLGPFVICIVKQRYIYAIPLALHNGKAYRADLQAAQPAEDSKEAGTDAVEEEKMRLKERPVKWEPVSVKNPKNVNCQLFPPTWAVELGDEYIMLLTGKGSLLFDWKEEQITDFASLRQKDDFCDGVCRTVGQVAAYGKLGVHTYSLTTGKWSFVPQMARPS